MVGVSFVHITLLITNCTGLLVHVWDKNIVEPQSDKTIIARAVRFVGKGDYIAIFGLESGMM